jgi:hypothetical protein
LVKYIVFLRILCQQSITRSDLNDAQTKKEVWTRISKLNTILPEGAKNRSLKAVYTAVKES